MGNAVKKLLHEDQLMPHAKPETKIVPSSTLFNSETLLTWVAAIVVAGMSAVVFLYTSFETMRDADDRFSQIEKHLDKIESKLDLLTLKSSGGTK